MKKQQSGFTLIELVVVIVILGILAATAIPKFVDLSSEAGKAAADGVSGAIASGTSVNYAKRLAGTTTGTTQLNDTNANTCTATNLANFVSGVTLTNGTGNTSDNKTYNVAVGSGTPATCLNSPGTATTCTLQGYKGAAVQVTVICTG